MAVTAVSGRIRFCMDPRNPHVSHMAGDGDGDTDAIEVDATTLDEEFAQLTGPCIVKSDVEGAEEQVIAGAKQFIRRVQPMLIFEWWPRRHAPTAMLSELGPGYDIYRLPPTGRLDTTWELVWNCVAIHRETPFAAACADLVETGCVA